VITALILSAGESSRMGEPKALLSWKGKTFLAHAIDAAKEAGIKNLVVVVGAHGKEISPEARTLGADIAVNENWRLGMGSSIKTGISYIQKNYPEAKGILILLSDQPKIQSAALSQLLAESQKNPERIVCAQYDNSPGVPALFPKNSFVSILNIQDKEGAKKLLLNNHPVLVPMPEAQDDIDTPEQLAVLRKLN
jgi:molybdenum cofactor cytidylyltransferase